MDGLVSLQSTWKIHDAVSCLEILSIDSKLCESEGRVVLCFGRVGRSWIVGEGVVCCWGGEGGPVLLGRGSVLLGRKKGSCVVGDGWGGKLVLCC